MRTFPLRRFLLLASLVVLLAGVAAASLYFEPRAFSAQNSGTIINNVAYSSLAAITSDDLYAPPSANARVDVYLYSTNTGTIQPQYVDLLGNVRNYGTALAVAANDLTVLRFLGAMPHSRFVFTPTAQPGTVWCDAFATPVRY